MGQSLAGQNNPESVCLESERGALLASKARPQCFSQLVDIAIFALLTLIFSVDKMLRDFKNTSLHI